MVNAVRDFLSQPSLMAIYHFYGTYIIAGITVLYATASVIRLRPTRRRSHGD